MHIFEWNDSLDVGIQSINDEHRALVDLINQLSDAMQSGKSKAIIGDVLNELVSYGVNHFNTEEKYFKTYDYPDAYLHIQEHEAFKQKAALLLEESKKETFKLSIDTLHFLRDWVSNHIKQTDMKYKEFLSTRIK